MKLNNFTAIDPAEHGRVKGLAGASARDREVWSEFHADRVPMSAESEALWSARVDRDGQLEPVLPRTPVHGLSTVAPPAAW